jgi:hypothetical protein
MDSIDWKGAVNRVKRVSIETYQAGKVKWDPQTATTVFAEQVTSNEPWGPTSKDCAKMADLTFDCSEAQKVMEVRCRRGAVRSPRRAMRGLGHQSCARLCGCPVPSAFYRVLCVSCAWLSADCGGVRVAVARSSGGGWGRTRLQAPRTGARCTKHWRWWSTC